MIAFRREIHSGCFQFKCIVARYSSLIGRHMVCCPQRLSSARFGRGFSSVTDHAAEGTYSTFRKGTADEHESTLIP